MNSDQLKITRHLPAMIAITLGAMTIAEYYGWKIIEKATGDIHFPGFLSPEVLASVSINTIGAFLIGAIFAALSLLIPSVRNRWRDLIHIPVWAGILLFNVYMIVLVVIGLRGV